MSRMMGAASGSSTILPFEDVTFREWTLGARFGTHRFNVYAPISIQPTWRAIADLVTPFCRSAATLRRSLRYLGDLLARLW